MRLLHELQRRGTIAAVAEALHFSPSGVSQQLAQLESEAGVTLLERVGRGVRLTDAARLLVTHTDAVLRQLERAEADLSTFHSRPSGTIRIAAFQTAALALIPPMLDGLSGHASLRVELTEVEPEQALPGLLARDFDLVVSEEYPGIPMPVSDEVDRVDLVSDPLELALPGDALESGRVTSLAQAAAEAWVMEPAGSMSRQWATNLCRSAGFEPDVRFESEDMLAHRELVRRGHAAAFLPSLLARVSSVGLPTLSLERARTILTLVRQGSERHQSILVVREALMRAAEPNRQPR